MAYYCIYCGKILTTGDKIDRCFDCPQPKIVNTLSDYDLLKMQCDERQAIIQQKDAEIVRLRYVLRTIAKAIIPRSSHKDCMNKFEKMQKLAIQVLYEVNDAGNE